MIDSSLAHARMTRHIGAGSPPTPSRVALLPASAACGAQLDLACPRGHANSESTIKREGVDPPAV
jgi:hypothetical protein